MFAQNVHTNKTHGRCEIIKVIKSFILSFCAHQFVRLVAYCAQHFIMSKWQICYCSMPFIYEIVVFVCLVLKVYMLLVEMPSRRMNVHRSLLLVLRSVNNHLQFAYTTLYEQYDTHSFTWTNCKGKFSSGQKMFNAESVLRNPFVMRVWIWRRGHRFLHACCIQSCK